MNKNKKKCEALLFFWFFKNCELIRDSSLWHSKFIPLVRDSIIITGSRCYTYTFGSCFDYKRWIRVFYKNLNLSFLGQLFQYCLLGLKACRLRFVSMGVGLLPMRFGLNLKYTHETGINIWP